MPAEIVDAKNTFHAFSADKYMWNLLTPDHAKPYSVVDVLKNYLEKRQTIVK